MILDKGIAEFSISDIGKAAKVTRSLLYWYFPNGVRDSLEAAAEFALTKRLAAAEASATACAHPVERLDAYLLAILTAHAAAPGESKVLLAAGKGLASQEKVLGELATGLRNGMSDGRVHNCSPEQVVSICAAAVDGALACNEPALAVVILNGLRQTLIRPLHSGQWRPAPVNIGLFMGVSGKKRRKKARGKVADAGTIGSISALGPKDAVAGAAQVVRPTGDWLELD